MEAKIEDQTITLGLLRDIFQLEFSPESMITELTDDGLFIRIGKREITIKDGQCTQRGTYLSDKIYFKVPHGSGGEKQPTE